MVSLNESLLTLSQAARSLPNLRGDGNGVNSATVWRWAMTGCKGVRLESAIVGGIRYTSREALERFFAATTAAADGIAAPVRTSRQREAAIAAAERELASA
jgi:hypothetical protein